MKISPQFSEGNIISSANLGIPFVLVFPIHLFEQTFISFNTQSFHEEKKKMKKKKERERVLSQTLKCLPALVI